MNHTRDSSITSLHVDNRGATQAHCSWWGGASERSAHLPHSAVQMCTKRKLLANHRFTVDPLKYNLCHSSSRARIRQNALLGHVPFGLARLDDGSRSRRRSSRATSPSRANQDSGATVKPHSAQGARRWGIAGEMHQLDYGSSVAEFEDWLACAPRMWTPEKRARPGALACHPARDRERYLTPTAGSRLTDQVQAPRASTKLKHGRMPGPRSPATHVRSC